MVIRYLSSTYILVFIKSCLLQNRLYLSLVALLVLLISATDGRLPFRFRFRDSVPAKRSYVSLQCRGEYDPSRFAQLDGICEDCYNLYREPEVHSLCRYSLIRHQTRKSENNPFSSVKIGKIASVLTLSNNACNLCYLKRSPNSIQIWSKSLAKRRSDEPGPTLIILRFLTQSLVFSCDVIHVFPFCS